MSKSDAGGDPPAPSHLKQPSQALWGSLVARYDFEDEERASLVLALESLDLAATARRTMLREGVVVTDRHGEMHPHPAVAIHRNALIAWRQYMTLLKLPLEEDDKPRIHPNANGRKARRGSQNAKA
ncbi:MAG: hypothetical protein JST53_00875 [Actinobacteria bacterium]|nr:hypothetical protein [Actinomycetota bacterium]